MTIHIIITMVLLLAFLIGSIWYAKKKYQINLAVLGLGAVAFFLSSQILEKLIHIIVLHPQKDGSIALLQDHPLVYIVYGLAMAAFFEETARLIFFKWLKKKRNLEKSDALAYGLGHGGLELIFLGVTSLINLYIVLSAVQTQNPQVLKLLSENMLKTIQSLSVWQIYLLAFERILALGFQMLLTVWVYQGVRHKNWVYLLAAYGLHAFFDLVPSLAQVGWITSPVLVEVILLVELFLVAYGTKAIFCKKS
ncbi:MULTISPECIES: YhfC family intramembrane metalloprotease [Streptococcus]|uniref:YhfC family intramembrane metalloprotease n=1 Tax=Streptococcus TaxID=1301 RepID=UPI00066C8CFD|nr:MULTISPECIES: YhfC family glutamic-type intramembrane protease [Streptococcus]MCP9059757.1 YhfC family glutamic-type intramembrane protease [Streptococcus sp. CF7_Ac1-12]MCP9084507.1 YhfC family glutamic-type intramembrane protease [Streptococcus sp. CF7_Ac1-8]MDK7203532.1 YhfC family glutamic-type intramembrane protease [Streptococcus sp. UMB1203]